MSKIKVSKELSDALNTALIQIGYSKSQLLTTHVDKVSDSTKWLSSSLLPLNNLTIADLSNILFNDYEVEVELTPHELIKLNWERMSDKYLFSSEDSKIIIKNIKEQTLFILNTLGEKVEGVNC